MTTEHDRRQAIAGLRGALPYLRLYQGKTFVIKAGGEVFDDPRHARALIEQLGVLHQLGIRIVFVHGGGAQTTRLAEELGVEVKLVDGRRVTCERTLEIAMMTLAGTTNTRIVAQCRGQGIRAVGVGGTDDLLVVARRRPPRRTSTGTEVDYGYVGDIERIEPRLVHRLLDGGFMPVVSPLAADAAGQILNVNADSVAAALATALDAVKLILVTSVEGVRSDPARADSLVSFVDLAGLDRLEATGAIQGGMLPKVAAIRAAIAGGVPRVHVISYRQPDTLLVEVFTNEGSGTLIVGAMTALAPEEHAPQGHGT